MTVQTVASQIVHWTRLAILIMILVALAVILLRAFGVPLQVTRIGHIELAYLAGVYWLTK